MPTPLKVPASLKAATPLKVEVLTASGCAACQHTKDLVRRMVDEHEAGALEYAEVNVVEEIDYAVAIGVLSTPAVAIGGKLAFGGPPSEKKLRRALDAALEQAARTHAPLEGQKP